MNKDRIADLREYLTGIKIKARTDTGLPVDKFSMLFRAIEALETAAEKYVSSLDRPRTGLDLKALERVQRKLTVIEAIQGVKNPAYFPQFAATLAEHPYALPQALFNPQGKEVVTIDFPNNEGKPQFYKERTDLALAILYPGSFTYRYGVPAKIETGQWSQTFVAHLHMHTLSPDPIFELERHGRTLDVYQPIRLRVRQVEDRRPFICVSCLSLAALDEGCFHSPQARRPLRLPSSSPIVVNQELGRAEGESAELRSPLNVLIPRVTSLRSLKVGAAVLGFERAAANRVTIVDYDPPIGMIMETKGIAFQVNIPTDFLHHIMQKRSIMRDVLTQTIAQWISELLSESGVPGYHLEPILSGLVRSIGVDGESMSAETMMEVFSKGDWIQNAIQTTMTQGTQYYERFDVQQRRLQTLYNAIAHRPLNESVLKNELKARLLHSLAHNLLIAGCVTSGCLPKDIEYLIGDNEVVLFDSADGGNGSSELIFEFCAAEESFSIAETEEEVREKIYRPKYFEEAFAELMLPCQQGVAERVFHRRLPTPGHQEIRRRVLALEKQRETYSTEYEYISKNGVENCFTSSIGYHVALHLQLPLRESERLKEALGVCLHGCPDCLALGSKCDEGGFHEKYYISKAVLDEYFRYLTRDVTIDYSASDSTIEALLEKRGVAILIGSVGKKVQEKTSEKLQERVSELNGRRIAEKFVKFAGFWLDCPMEAEEIQYSAMMVLA